MTTPKEPARHIHTFIPGVRFDDFLKGISLFLESNPTEMVFLQITADGISRTLFKPLADDQTAVDGYLKAAVSSKVGYQFIDDFSQLGEKKLSDWVATKPRLIVILNKPNVNDSYSDAYGASLDDPSQVVDALVTAALAMPTSNANYHVLQLQDTGSGAIVSTLKGYGGDISRSQLTGGILGLVAGTVAGGYRIDKLREYLLSASAGSLLQATKPVFDAATYSWLTRPKALDCLQRSKAPVVLLNDFVDPALTSHSVGLTKYRIDHRNVKSTKDLGTCKK